ncbi:MAG: ABC transporter permease [Gemmatirosa sp.]|nr:ABC transporter permease [Gemmatirosa sp.]
MRIAHVFPIVALPGAWLRETARDLRHALRAFRREPAFAAGVVLTFALAIGANAAMFGLVERLMLAPPPGIRDAARVVRVAERATGGDGASFTLSTTSYPAFRAVAAIPVFDDVAAVRADSVTTGRGADLAEASVVQASGRYFAVLGVRPSLGRLFGSGDDVLPDGNDVVVLGHAYWRRRFAGDPAVIGRPLVVDDAPLTIVGVAPAGFDGTELAPVDLYVPLTTAMRARGAGWWSTPGMRLVSIVARLRAGVAPAAAVPMATAALRGSAPAVPEERPVVAVLESLVPGRSARESPAARIALWLSGVSLVVLLVATANVGTLLLLRAARRRRDHAVRTALGAARTRLARQALAESLLLALAGCVAGMLVARWLAEAVRVLLLPNLAPAAHVVDRTVLLASIAVACGAGLLAGLGPLVPLGRRDLADLRGGAGRGASGRFVVQHALVAAQVALCMVLLVGAGLFVRSLQRVRSQDLGFSTAQLLHVTLDFRGAVPAVERDRVHREAARRVAALRGVTGATVVQGMPFASHNIPPIAVPGYDLPSPTAQQLPILYGATPAYLDLMGVTLREGRLFDARDGAGAPLVVLVNETMARTAWPGRSAIGRCVQAGFGLTPPGPGADPMADAASLPCRTVVGVVRDSRARSLRLDGGEGRLMQYYVPFDQLPDAPFPDAATVHGLLVRTAGPPERLASAVQRAIQGASAVPVYARVRPYQELIDPQLRAWRLGATLFTALGALASGIAAVGLFAVVSYLVAQRRREIGVRLALGGTSGRVARRVVRDAVRMAGIGAVIGAVVAFAIAPAMQSMLFETSAREPATTLGAAALLLAVAAVAAMFPAWRAGRVNPLVALRDDG